MVLDLFKLDGKTAVVTGSNAGIGEALTLALAEAGADIAGVDISESNRSDPASTQAQVEAMGRRFYPIRCDLSKMDAIPYIVEETVKAYGKIDILVNNAGVILRDDAIRYSEKMWDTLMSINLKALFFLSQAVAKNMIASGKGGKIINIASLLSYQGGLRIPAYTAAKSGVRGLTMALSNEWGCKGININAIAPGYIETKGTSALQEDQKRYNDILQRIPAGYWGTPDDLKATVVYLASAASDYVNGFTVAVDGGWLGY